MNLSKRKNISEKERTINYEIHQLGCAGKGGKTTNFEIPEWMFDREYAEYKNGGVVNA